MKEETKRWMRQAGGDLRTAKYLFGGKLYKEASFFCQQSAEKALKAVLLERTGEIMKIHDLVRLGKELSLDEEMLDDCERLSIVYVESRYPGVGDQEYTAKETGEDMRLAETMLKWAEKNLS